MYLHTFPSQQLSNTFTQRKTYTKFTYKLFFAKPKKKTTVREYQICWTRQQESKLYKAFALLGYYMA